MSLGNTFENDLVKLILQAVPIANLADNAASSPITDIYVALHTADPGESGAQNTSEAAYTGYARIAVERSAGGWDVTDNVGANAEEILFGECTASPGSSITHASIGTASSGTGKILLSGALQSPITMSTGVQPRFPAGELTVTLD